MIRDVVRRLATTLHGPYSADCPCRLCRGSTRVATESQRRHFDDATRIRTLERVVDQGRRREDLLLYAMRKSAQALDDARVDTSFLAEEPEC